VSLLIWSRFQEEDLDCQTKLSVRGVQYEGGATVRVKIPLLRLSGEIFLYRVSHQSARADSRTSLAKVGLQQISCVFLFVQTLGTNVFRSLVPRFRIEQTHLEDVEESPVLSEVSVGFVSPERLHFCL
jgi:hypothetical protein